MMMVLKRLYSKANTKENNELSILPKLFSRQNKISPMINVAVVNINYNTVHLDKSVATYIRDTNSPINL